MSPVLSEKAESHLRWALTDGIGPTLFSRLLIHFGSARAALEASPAELATVKGIGQQADAIGRSRDSAPVESEIEAARAGGVRIICREDEEYPEGLKRIPDAPIVLCVRGELRRTDTIAVAVVGTRRCSIYGSEQARRFGELLAGAGYTVVSGLARGVDAFAHHGAVDAGGRSIAVLGNGLSEIYPPENAPLADRMAEHGALVSELPMRASVRRENFEGRNRIIAGMSLGTLVIEAPLRSGALITARLAMEYNREVFALPGRVQEPQCAGSNQLIRDGGAKLVTCLEDILDELGALGAALRPDTSQAQKAPSTPPEPEKAAPSSPALNAIEQRVFDVVLYEPMLFDLVVRASALSVAEVLAALTALELKGLVRRLPGQMVMRAGRA